MSGQMMADELKERQNKAMERIFRQNPELDTILISNRLNQYYLTGTLQDGLLVLKKDGLIHYFVRKSYERAKMECPFDWVTKMHSYRDMLAFLPQNLGRVGTETEWMTIATKERLGKYFILESIESIDSQMLSVRAVKSERELALIAESGRQQAQLQNEIIPGLLRCGMSEADLLAEIYEAMVKLGHHGVSRFGMPQTELIAGQIGFGENSIYPTCFDGPDGMRGLSPAVPMIGDRHRFLKKGDLVFVDIGYGVDGYHSDKTQVYSYGQPPSEEVAALHHFCRQVLAQIVEKLVPGAIPSQIYESVMADLPDQLKRHFMGFGTETVRFLGHGVGLQIDEAPVIALHQTEPIKENMVIAIEPKRGIPGYGMVGVEETYVITKEGALCLTGGDRDIIEIA